MPCIILRLIVSHSAVCLILLTDGRCGDKRHLLVIENFTDGKPLMKTSEICWHMSLMLRQDECLRPNNDK